MRPPCTCGPTDDPAEVNPNCPHHGYNEETGEQGQSWDEGYQEYLADYADEEPLWDEDDPGGGRYTHYPQ